MNAFLNSLRTLRDEYRKPFLGLLGFLLSIFSLDFLLRVMVLRDSSVRNFSAPKGDTISVPATADAVLRRLEAWIPKPVIVEPPPAERQIVLQGIFGAGAEAKAVIALVSPDGGSTERTRATVGMQVDGWTVEKISMGKVVLKKGEEHRELVLFPGKPG